MSKEVFEYIHIKGERDVDAIVEVVAAVAGPMANEQTCPNWREKIEYEVRRTLEREISGDFEQSWHKEFNSQYAVITEEPQGVVLEEWTDTKGRKRISQVKPTQVRLRWANEKVEIPTKNGVKKVNKFDLWIASKNRREVRQIIFDPRPDAPEGYFNIWQGLKIEPKQADRPELIAGLELYWNHWRLGLCSGDEAMYVYARKWLAHLVQRPWELPKTSLAIYGVQGAGKNVAFEPFRLILGEHFMPDESVSTTLEHFNSQSVYAVLMLFNENYWAGSKALEGPLKALVTEPTRRIERKHEQAYSIDNCLRCVFLSNLDHIVPVGPHDRRYAVTKASDVFKGNSDHFDRIWKFAQNEAGAAAILYDLMQEDLSNFDLTKIPHTAAKTEQRIYSMSPVQTYWHTKLVQESYAVFGETNDLEYPRWSEKICEADKNAVYDNFQKSNRKNADIPYDTFWRRTKALNLGGSRQRHNGERIYKLKPLTQARAAFAEAVGEHESMWDDEPTNYSTVEPQPKKRLRDYCDGHHHLPLQHTAAKLVGDRRPRSVQEADTKDTEEPM